MSFETTEELRRLLTARAVTAPTHMAVMYRQMLAVMDHYLLVLPSKKRRGRVEFHVAGKGYRRRKPGETRAGLGLAGL